MGKWYEIEHTADLALHLQGADWVDLFTVAAQGMIGLIFDPAGVAVERTLEVELESVDLEALLVDWLNELLYLGEREGLAFVSFDFSVLEPQRLRAMVGGGAHPPYQHYIKAATFHDLKILSTPAGYETEIVFDT